MARRTHRKSRNGCNECKKRHVKCDETRPICVNCSTSQRQCSYIQPHCEQSTYSSPAASTRDFSTPSHTAPSPHSDPTTSFQDTPNQQPSNQFQVNLFHTKLLTHFFAESEKMFGTVVSKATLDNMMKSALAAPYLVHEVLAMAALHLSTLCPAKKELYETQAAGLQTQALSIYNSAQHVIDATNCTPMLLFSSLTSMHVLFNAVTAAGSGSDFLDKFITYLDVHRGVRTIASQSWHLIPHSELGPVVQAATAIRPETNENGEKECDKMLELFDLTDLNQASIETCLSAIKHLQWAFDVDRAQPDLRAGMHMVFAWPALVPVEYTRLLSKRNPEALIILAHYGILLHSRRRVWIIGDAGRNLIQSVSAVLGSYWKPWLSWPNSEVTTNSPLT